MPHFTRLLPIGWIAGTLLLAPALPAAEASNEARGLIPGLRVVDLRHGDAATALTFSPDGKLLATGGGDGTIKLWDRSLGRPVRSIDAHDSIIGGLAFSPDRKVLASCGHDRLVKLWDPARGKEMAVLRGHEGPVVALAYSPDGKTLASASWDRTVKLWDRASGKETLTLKGHTLAVTAVCFRARGEEVISASWDGSVRFWNAKTGTAGTSLPHGSLVFDVALGGERMLASCGGVRAVKFREVLSGKDRPGPEGLEGPVFHLAFSADGRTLATGGAHPWIQLWETASGAERAMLPGPAEKCTAVAFSPDGRWLAAAAGDGSVRAWELVPERSTRHAFTPAELKALGADLAGKSSARAYRAVLALAAAPDQAVPVLKELVQPASIAQPARIAQLIQRLDNDQFADRQQAERELEQLAEQAGPALRKALAARLPSLEVRRRLERLVQVLDGKTLSLEQLQAIRGIEVFEHIGSTEARAALQTLGKAPPARRTEEARETLDRLARRLH